MRAFRPLLQRFWVHCRAIYNLGILSMMDSATWFADAILIIVALPLGLIFARIVTDKTFRYCT